MRLCLAAQTKVLIRCGNAKQFPQGAVTFFHKLLTLCEQTSARSPVAAYYCRKLLRNLRHTIPGDPKNAHKRFRSLTDGIKSKLKPLVVKKEHYFISCVSVRHLIAELVLVILAKRQEGGVTLPFIACALPLEHKRT